MLLDAFAPGAWWSRLWAAVSVRCLSQRHSAL